MTSDKRKQERVALPYQEILRLLVGMASIAAIASVHLVDEVDFVAMAVIAAIVIYLFLSNIISRTDGSSSRNVIKFFSYLDAMMIGGVIAYLQFSMLPMLLFLIIVQFNALIRGGFQKLLEDNAAVLIGVVLTIVGTNPVFTLQTDLRSNVATLLAIAVYICLYAYTTNKQNNHLRGMLKSLEQEQIKLKLNNYRLSKYLSPTLGKLISSGKEVKLETQRKKLTIFFSDIKGFSQLSEEMETEALTGLLNTYLTTMSEIALKYGGTIDKYIGDAIMVFFGDPETKGIKEDCVAAVSMAIEMKKKMKELQLSWAQHGIQNPLEIRMGLNTGFCVVGNFGTENRLDYTLLGTEVNLASRLESAAAAGEILISHETYSLCKDTIYCVEKGEIDVKGYQHPVKVYSAVDFRWNVGKESTYYEKSTQGFSLYLDIEQLKNYDKKSVLLTLEEAHNRLRKTNID
ncbi:MAG: adenylate/guanylate cyclase domain-containing protein [bacterium]